LRVRSLTMLAKVLHSANSRYILYTAFYLLDPNFLPPPPYFLCSIQWNVVVTS